MRRILWWLSLVLFWASPAWAQLPVVPGAPLAAGMETRAAYGNATNPTVYRITTTANSGAGSLREAMEASGNRVIIFERSGTITLTSDIIVNDSYMTVAGQTAPDPGITLKDYGVQIDAHDILIQHLRFRKGPTCASGQANAIEIWGNNNYNIVLDHVSASWGQDETIIFNNPSRSIDTVLWRSIASEGLFQVGGCSQFSNGHSVFVNNDTKGVTIAQSLMAKSNERNPYSKGNTAMTMVNSVVFGWQGLEGVLFSNLNAIDAPGPRWFASVVGNRFIATTASIGACMFAYSDNGGEGTDGDNEIYRSDNTLANNPGGISTECNELGYDPNVGSAPSEAPLPSGYTILGSTVVEAKIIEAAGARPAARDLVDSRLLTEMAARSSAVQYGDDPSDWGGWPTLAVNTRSLTTPTSPNADDDGDGYTNLEEWLQGYALDVEGTVNGPDDVTPAAGAVIVSDTFTDTDGTPATSHAPGIGSSYVLQSGSTGVLEITANGRLMGVNTATGSLTLNTASPLTANYDAKADWRVITLIPGNSYSMWLRALTTEFTGYGASYEPSSLVWTLFKFVNGVYTGLGSCVMALSTNTTYEVVFRARLSSKHLVIDGTQCTSTDDNELAAAGKAGFSVYHTTADTETTGIHFDNFLVTDVATVPTTTMCAPCRLRFTR